jgi:hypothetical protein
MHTALVPLVILSAPYYGRQSNGRGKEITVLLDEYESKLKEFIDLRDTAKTEDERAKAYRKHPNPNQYGASLMKLVEKHPNEPEALDAIVWIVKHNQDSGVDVGKALDFYVRNPKQDGRLAGVIENLLNFSTPQIGTALKALFDKNPDRTLRGRAGYVLASVLRHSAPREADYYRGLILQTYGNVTTRGGATLADAIHAPDFERTQLAIGKPVPDIEGEDIDGTRFKLSDYRGKVLLLSFWGHW